jgi:hypothetical protein
MAAVEQNLGAYVPALVSYFILKNSTGRPTDLP